MKVAKKSPGKASARATLTLNGDTYATIDRLRGAEARSVWIQHLVEEEEKRRERQRLLQRVRDEYTPTVVRETLKLNAAFPIHEK